MSLTSSMNAGVAGLSANSNRLATISDNISNSATHGYRRAQTNFHALVVGSGQPGQGSYSAGGVRSSVTRLIDQGGTLISTQHPTDLAVSGRGFLPVTSELGASITDGTAPLLLKTTGSFRPDDKGVLRDAAGMALLGWPAGPDGTVPQMPRDSISGLRPVIVDPSATQFAPTSYIGLGVSLPAAGTLPDAPGDTLQLDVEYFNPLGLPRSLEVAFAPQIDPAGATNTWDMAITDTDTGDVLGTYEVAFSGASGLGGTIDSITRTSVQGEDYDPATGTLDLLLSDQDIELRLGVPGETSGLNQGGSSFRPSGIEKDGSDAANLIGLSMQPDGTLDAIFEQGLRRTLYKVPLVDVANPNGLASQSNQSYQVTRESGPFFLWDAGDGPTGSVTAFALEESATDIAAELTSLIATQRAYSSNAKVIQTVDEMFQETTNIKR